MMMGGLCLCIVAMCILMKWDLLMNCKIGGRIYFLLVVRGGGKQCFAVTKPAQFASFIP